MKRNKYNAIKVKADGITFDSKLEHKRYQELKLLVKTGEIDRLRVHQRYPLCTGNPMIHVIGHYEADFDYLDMISGQQITEDCKGVVTALSKWKMKHFGYQYGRPVWIIRK